MSHLLPLLTLLVFDTTAPAAALDNLSLGISLNPPEARTTQLIMKDTAPLKLCPPADQQDHRLKRAIYLALPFCSKT